MAKSISIVEVGPRDGLQNEATEISVQDRFQFVHQLAAAGLKRIEVGAFVSPQWVPQMKGSAELINQLNSQRKSFAKDIRFSVLVPNEKGMQLAMQTAIKEVAIFGACSEGFSQKNINCTIAESFDRFRAVMKIAKQKKIKVRGYLSTAFGCPYEGYVDPKVTVKLTKEMLKLGVYEVSIGDTIGVATPAQVDNMMKLLKRAGIPFKKIAMHFHDTRGTALANVEASLRAGIVTFDSSLGGLGGCPYAKGSSGNLATEDLVYMLEGMGYKTGVKLEALIALKAKMDQVIGRKLPAKVSNAGLPTGYPLWGSTVM
jgi:hydroxymethylglutaryl-CoA lyase